MAGQVRGIRSQPAALHSRVNSLSRVGSWTKVVQLLPHPSVAETACAHEIGPGRSKHILALGISAWYASAIISQVAGFAPPLPPEPFRPPDPDPPPEPGRPPVAFDPPVPSDPPDPPWPAAPVTPPVPSPPPVPALPVLPPAAPAPTSAPPVAPPPKGRAPSPSHPVTTPERNNRQPSRT